jgi:hypothetical protein
MRYGVSPNEDSPRSGAGTSRIPPLLFRSSEVKMAYGKGRKIAITGTKIGNHGKRGPGLKLHSDMKDSHAKGHGKAPKMARKSM